MDANPQYGPRTVEEVFRDFKGRRAGLIKALTSGKMFQKTISVILSIWFELSVVSDGICF